MEEVDEETETCVFCGDSKNRDLIPYCSDECAIGATRARKIDSSNRERKKSMQESRKLSPNRTASEIKLDVLRDALMKIERGDFDDTEDAISIAAHALLTISRW